MYNLKIKSTIHGELNRDFNTVEEIAEFIDASKEHYGLDAVFSWEDVSEKKLAERNIKKNLARMEFGKQIMAELAQRNQDRLLKGQTTISEILDIESKTAVIQRLLLNGSLSLALQGLIQTVIVELPQSEKDYFVNKIQAYLAGE